MAIPESSDVELAVLSSAVTGDAGKLYRLVASLMDRGVPFDSILFDILMGAERSVGLRWAQGDYLIAEEHTVTATIETVISLLAGSFDQPTEGPLVVVATAEGDDHSLPARAVAAHLVYLGFRTTLVGAGIPAADLREFLEIEPPAALVLSATMTSHLLGARSVISAAHELGVPVIVGGKAFGADGAWAPAAGADAHVGSLRDVGPTVEAWLDGAAPEPADLADLPSELEEVRAGRLDIVTRAEAALGADSRFRHAADLLVGAIEGAMLTGDDRVLAETVDWQRQTLQAQGLGGSEVIDAVLPLIQERSAEAAAVLSRAASS